LVSSTTNSSRSGSAQIDVPVKPVWPKLRDEKNRPALDCGDGVSQPNARLASTRWRAVQRATVDAFSRRIPPYEPPLPRFAQRLPR